MLNILVVLRNIKTHILIHVYTKIYYIRIVLVK